MRNTANRIWIIVLILVLAAACTVLGLYGYQVWWLSQQPKFHDLTVELGAEMPPVSAFITEYAEPEAAPNDLPERVMI